MVAKSSTNTELLNVSDLRVYFEKANASIKAVDGVSFNVYEGENFGIVGESGSGKSVTIKSIIGLIHPPGRIVTGSIKFKGQELTQLDNNDYHAIRGNDLAMIMQDPMTALNPVMRIKEQIKETLEEDGSVTEKEAIERSIEMMRLVGIPAPERRLNEYPHQFSGGMRQRVMIAIALSRNPKLLLADEPTTAVDVTIQDQILKLLVSLQHRLGMGLIFVTHDLGVIAQTSDRVAVMYAGRIMEMTDTVTLFKSPHHPYTMGLMHSVPSNKLAGEKLDPIPGLPPNLARVPTGCRFHPRCHFATDECRSGEISLREVAPGHVSACIKDVR